MGLPASVELSSDKVAPRMDLMVVRSKATPPSIAFWEAKWANNPELRIGGDAAPKALGQLQRYVAWITADRIAQVQQAYSHTARVLLDLHAPFRAGEDAACVAVWRALARPTRQR